MERGIQYLRELVTLEVAYGDLDSNQLFKGPDKVKCMQPMWGSLYGAHHYLCDSSLAVMTWKDGGGQMVDELAGCHIKGATVRITQTNEE